MLIMTYFLINYFIDFAKNKNIVAIGNNKNLHEGIIPRGAGIVFGGIYIVFITISYINHLVPLNFFLPIIFGSLFCLLLGFFDDIFDLKAKYKFFFQNLIIISLILYFYFPSFKDNLNFLFFGYFTVLIIFTVWMLNAFNFLDGTDGHLSCVAMMQSILMMVISYF